MYRRGAEFHLLLRQGKRTYRIQPVADGEPRRYLVVNSAYEKRFLTLTQAQVESMERIYNSTDPKDVPAHDLDTFMLYRMCFYTLTEVTNTEVGWNCTCPYFMAYSVCKHGVGFGLMIMSGVAIPFEADVRPFFPILCGRPKKMRKGHALQREEPIPIAQHTVASAFGFRAATGNFPAHKADLSAFIPLLNCLTIPIAKTGLGTEQVLKWLVTAAEVVLSSQ